MTDPNWRLRAACRGLHPNLFHGERGDSHAYRHAISICNGDPVENIPPCPVLSDCLTWILEEYSGDNDAYGIYAGTTPNQRSMIRRGKMIRPDIERDIEREHTPESETPATESETVVVAATITAAAPVTVRVPRSAIDPARWVSEYRNGLLDRMTREQIGT